MSCVAACKRTANVSSKAKARATKQKEKPDFYRALPRSRWLEENQQRKSLRERGQWELNFRSRDGTKETPQRQPSFALAPVKEIAKGMPKNSGNAFRESPAAKVKYTADLRSIYLVRTTGAKDLPGKGILLRQLGA